MGIEGVIPHKFGTPKELIESLEKDYRALVEDEGKLLMQLKRGSLSPEEIERINKEIKVINIKQKEIADKSQLVADDIDNLGEIRKTAQ